VTTGALESALQAAAREAGARVEHGRYVPGRSGSERFTLDCTGRAGLLARRWRVYEPSLRTVALIGVWRAPAAFDVDDPTHTLVESYANGWAWSVPDAAGRRHVAVMVDPRTSDLERGTAARSVYLAEISKTRRLAALVRRAALEEGPVGWDASAYSASQYTDGDTLLVGDAGSFLDPLSSAGVKKALASGWLAAIAVHTALRRPAMRDVALGFFAAREDLMHARFRDLTRRFLAEAAAGHAHPFWRDRGHLDEAEPPAAADEALTRAALDRLRAAPALRLDRAPEVRIEARPAVSASEIVVESRIVSSADPAGVRYVCDVDLLALLDIAPRSAQVPDAFEEYNRRHAPVGLPEFLTALATAVARRWLVER
jgi:flavin-dependent dehydrogenase